MSRAGLCTFDDCEIIRVTDAGGVCVQMDDGRKVWLYKDQIHDNSEVWKLGDTGSLVVPEWVAMKKGMI